MTAADVLAVVDHVLLDFDGPVCAVFGGHLSDRDVADRLKVLVGSDLPHEVRATNDPFEVLKYAASCGPKTGGVVEAQLRRLETEAVVSAPTTPGVVDALRHLNNAGYTVTIVSNNSASAVRAFLTVHDLAGFVRGIAARTFSDPSLLKPNPYLVNMAVRGRGTTPDRCVLVGDSSTDIDAAQSTGVPVIAYANKPGKLEQFRARHADAVITSMMELSPSMA
jgi:HAD superfamily hydrolase (TIGR01662 family)